MLQTSDEVILWTCPRLLNNASLVVTDKLTTVKNNSRISVASQLALGRNYVLSENERKKGGEKALATHSFSCCHEFSHIKSVVGGDVQPIASAT